MKNGGWLLIPAAFFLCFNFINSQVKVFFFRGLAYFCLFIFLFLILRKFTLDKILAPIVAGISIVLFCYGLVQKFVLFPQYLQGIEAGRNFYLQTVVGIIETGRIFALFTLPTLYAIICAVLNLFIFHFFLRSRHKVFWLILLLMGLFNLVLTQSFGGILYLAIGILVYLFLYRILKFRYLAPTIMVLFLFLFIVIVLRFPEAKEFEPVKLRFTNWMQSCRMIKKHPVSGVGLGNYQALVSYHTKPREAKSIYAHNFVLQFISEVGFIVAIFFIFILFFYRKRLIPEKYQDKVVYLSALLMLIFYNMVDVGFYFFSAGLVAAIALSQIYPKKNSKIGIKIILALFLSAILLVDHFSQHQQKEAEFFMSLDDLNQAEQHFQKSIRFNPYQFKSLLGLAFLYFSKNDLDRAENFVDRSLAIFKESSYANYLKSRLEYHKEHFFSSLFYAAVATDKNRLNQQFKRWYEHIKSNLQSQITKSRN